MTKLPNFIVIGAPKCGTTSLYHYLRAHPEVYLPEQKELHFFSYSDIEKCVGGPGDREALTTMAATFEEYSTHYRSVRGERAIGEVSPSYLYFSGAAERIVTHLGSVKIVVILRNPIEKAYSQYFHLVRDGRERLPFGEALAAEEERRAQGWSDFWRYAESSLYCERVEEYMRVFGKDRVKVLIFEEFVRDSAAALKDLCRFLDINEDIDLPTEEAHHRSGRPRSALISRILSRPNPLKAAAHTLLPRSVIDAVQRRIWAYNTVAKDPMDERVASDLRSYFRDDVVALESMLGRTLPWFAPLG